MSTILTPNLSEPRKPQRGYFSSFYYFPMIPFLSFWFHILMRKSSCMNVTSKLIIIIIIIIIISSSSSSSIIIISSSSIIIIISIFDS